MKSHSLFEKMIVACFILVAIPIFTAAQSIEDGTFFRMSSLIGLSKGESASLNVTNSSRAIIAIRFYFIDAEGRLLKSSSARVMPGQSLSLMLPYSELRDATGRVQVRGVVRADPPGESDPPSESDPPCEADLVQSSLEVYDEATGKTSFGLLLPAIRGTNVYLPFIEDAIKQER